MKKKLHPILFCVGVFIVVLSACQKQEQPIPTSAISNKENKVKNVDGNDIKDNEHNGHIFDNTFTKYVNNYPYMTGIVGGDVGTGTYAGEVLKMSTVGYITSVEALYHFNGRNHSFTAHVFVTENDAPGVGTAAITGRVTEGWLKGASVTGEYKVWGSCPIPTPGNQEGTQCYQGVLHLQVPKDEGHHWHH
jgi:hypothetical protein